MSARKGVNAPHFSVSGSKNSRRICGNAARNARSQRLIAWTRAGRRSVRCHARLDRYDDIGAVLQRDQVQHLGDLLACHQKTANVFPQCGLGALPDQQRLDFDVDEDSNEQSVPCTGAATSEFDRVGLSFMFLQQIGTCIR